MIRNLFGYDEKRSRLKAELIKIDFVKVQRCGNITHWIRYLEIGTFCDVPFDPESKVGRDVSKRKDFNSINIDLLSSVPI